MTRPDDAPAFARPPRGDGRLLAGVCAGLAARWDLSPLLVRGAFVVASLAYGAGVLLYAALALTMPARGASAERVARSAEAGRTLIVALRVAGATAALAVVGVLAAGLALFGLGVVALLLACACVIALVVRPELRAAPLGAAAVALTLPAAAVALSDAQVAPSFGDRTIELRTPSDVDPAGYRAGTGSLLVDLRRFTAAPGPVTTIRARADLRSLVVALPRDRCFHLIVDQTLDREWPAELLNRQRPAMLHLGSPARFPLPRERDLARAGQPPSLVAYGRPVMGKSVRWKQRTEAVGAPTVHLQLTTGRSQAIVRDYPDTAHPLDQPWWPMPRQFAIPDYGTAQTRGAAASVPNDPFVPTLLRNIVGIDRPPRSSTLGIRQARDLVMGALDGRLTPARSHRLSKFVTDELILRRATRELTAYRDRFVGRCLTPEAKRRTFVPVESRQNTRAASMLLARWSVVWKRWGGDPRLKESSRLNEPVTNADPIRMAIAMAEGEALKARKR